MDEKFTSSFQLQLDFAHSECVIMHLGNVVKYLLYSIFTSWARSTVGVIVLPTSTPANVRWAQANSKWRQTWMNMSHCIQPTLPSSNGWKLQYGKGNSREAWAHLTDRKPATCRAVVEHCTLISVSLVRKAAAFFLWLKWVSSEYERIAKLWAE